MKIIDTHSHIYLDDFDNDIDQVIYRARQNGVANILLPNLDPESLDAVHRLANQYPGYCLPMMGLHPCSVTKEWRKQLDILQQQFSQRKYVAVGEIGIDLYWDQSLETEQIEAFEQQLHWSIEQDLPVAIHSRNAIAQCIASIKRVGEDRLRGVFHSFSDTLDEMHAILSLGNFMLGINGVVTFKNSTLSTILRETDLSHIIVETDAPYLAPVPFRGKRNEPAYTKMIVNKLAEIFDTTADEVADITSKNAERLFDLEK